MKPTLGSGKLENLLARWRMRVALGAINPSLHGGDVLDIGCGTHPVFLLQSPFRRKVGLDQISSSSVPPGIEAIHLPLEKNVRLPFPDQSFDCVTSLALLEHLEPEILPDLLREARRVLRPSGQFVATTPHAFADLFLRLLARANLVSREEIEEHKSRFFWPQVRSLLSAAGFTPEKIRVGGFQFGMNILMVAEK